MASRFHLHLRLLCALRENAYNLYGIATESLSISCMAQVPIECGALLCMFDSAAAFDSALSLSSSSRFVGQRASHFRLFVSNSNVLYLIHRIYRSLQEIPSDIVNYFGICVSHAKLLLAAALPMKAWTDGRQTRSHLRKNFGLRCHHRRDR